MLAAVALILSVLWGVIRGGQLSRLASLQLRGQALYVCALGIQGVFVYTDLVGEPYRSICYGMSFVPLIIGAWLDRRIPGIAVIAGGLCLNGLAVSLNGGKMPVLVPGSMIGASGTQALKHAAIDQATRLAFLGDIIRIPLLGGHFTLLSVGDIVLVAGLFMLVERQTAPR